MKVKTNNKNLTHRIRFWISSFEADVNAFWFSLSSCKEMKQSNMKLEKKIFKHYFGYNKGSTYIKIVIRYFIIKCRDSQRCICRGLNYLSNKVFYYSYKHQNYLQKLLIITEINSKNFLIINLSSFSWFTGIHRNGFTTDICHNSIYYWSWLWKLVNSMKDAMSWWTRITGFCCRQSLSESQDIHKFVFPWPFVKVWNRVNNLKLLLYI